MPGYNTELLVERARALVEIKKDERAIVVNIASCYFIKTWDQGLDWKLSRLPRSRFLVAVAQILVPLRIACDRPD